MCIRRRKKKPTSTMLQRFRRDIALLHAAPEKENQAFARCAFEMFDCRHDRVLCLMKSRTGSRRSSIGQTHAGDAHK